MKLAQRKMMDFSKALYVLITVSIVLSLISVPVAVAAVIIWESVFLTVSIFGMLAYILSIVMMFFIRAIFNELRLGASPFSYAVIDLTKKTSHLMIAVAIFSLSIGVLITAAVVWAMALIFEYGRILQEESDATL